jgi:hypothetical protein
MALAVLGMADPPRRGLGAWGAHCNHGYRHCALIGLSPPGRRNHQQRNQAATSRAGGFINNATSGPIHPQHPRPERETYHCSRASWPSHRLRNRPPVGLGGCMGGARPLALARTNAPCPSGKHIAAVGRHMARPAYISRGRGCPASLDTPGARASGAAHGKGTWRPRAAGAARLAWDYS